MASLARPVPFLIVLLVLTWAWGQPAWGAEQRRWAELSAGEREALAPIAATWDKLPVPQQDKLLKVAQAYHGLDAHHQRLLQTRLRLWTQMTPEERTRARENYRKLSQLPENKQSEIKRRWYDACDQLE